jgi:signal transduction histidine kinase
LNELPTAQADREGIHRALLNVLTNALDAVEDRKTPRVGISTSLESVKDPVGDWVCISVVDNGVGIPPENVSDIFKPFQSTKGERGTGLGLAVSRKILREHGGDIHVQSIIGKGSKFVLRFPLLSPLASDNTLNG